MKISRTMAATPDSVWGVVSHLDEWAEHLPTVDAIEPLDDGAPRVGARYRVSQPGLLPATYTVTDWQPGRAFTWVARTPGVTTTASHRVAPVDQGTELVLTLDWFGPLGWLVRLLLTRKSRTMVDREAATFAQLTESDAAAP